MLLCLSARVWPRRFLSGTQFLNIFPQLLLLLRTPARVILGTTGSKHRPNKLPRLNIVLNGDTGGWRRKKTPRRRGGVVEKPLSNFHNAL